LDRYKEIVFETADYMATFVDFDTQRQQYVLGPAVASAEEKHTDYVHNLNPTMELGYWKWALERPKSGVCGWTLPRNEQWQKVIDHLRRSRFATAFIRRWKIPVENSPARMATWLYGILPAAASIEMRCATRCMPFARRWKSNLGQPPWWQCVAARLNEPERAIQLLVGGDDKKLVPPVGLHHPAARPNSHVHARQCGWLAATAIWPPAGTAHRARAWLPKTWKVRYEGLQPAP